MLSRCVSSHLAVRRAATILAALLVLGLAPTESLAARPKLVMDIEQSTIGCITSALVPGPDAFYFGTSSRCRGGLALWRTDGTVLGTRPVRTFDGGASGFELVQPLVDLDGTLLLGLGTENHAGAPMVELWRSDGSEGGTTLVRAFAAPVRVALRSYRGPASVVLGDRLLFFTEEESTGDATPWVTDGTPQGTHAIEGLAGPMGLPGQILVHQGAVYVVAYHQGQSALLRIDETFTAIMLLGFLGDAGMDDAPVDPTVAVGPDGAVWFQRTVATSQRELWRTDGTPATTTRVRTLPFRAVWALAGDVHYLFEERRGTARVSRLDPATGALTLLHDFAPPPLGTNDFWVRARDHGLVYFGYGYQKVYPQDVWRSDGTTAGTFRIFDGYVPGDFVPLADGLAFFPADEGSNPLWHTDGTVAGTLPLVADSAFGFDQFTALGDGSTLFVATGFERAQLYRTDAAAAGTSVVQDFPWAVSTLAARDGVAVLFSFGTLWRTDGTAGGTFPLLEVGPNTQGSSPQLLTDVAGTLFLFVKRPLEPRLQLWRSDGRRKGTERIVEWESDDWRGDGEPRLPTAAGARLYFVKGAGELWTSDGTAGGTSAIAELGGGDPESRIHEIEDLDGAAYLAVRGAKPTQGALWRSAGTDATTTVVAPLAARSLVTWNDAIYFTAVPSPKVAGVWRSDGTPGGTRPLVKIRAAHSGQRPRIGPLLGGEDALWFSVGTPGRTELWRSDGTRAGTAAVDDLPAPTNGFGPGVNDGIEIDGSLLFSMWPDLLPTSTNLWRSSGLPGGVEPVAAIYPFSDLGSFTRAGEHVFFKSPSDEIAGVLFFPQDLWVTDGTADGTMQLLEGASLLGPMVADGDVLYLCAAAPGESFRMWRSDGTPAGTVPAFGGGVGCGGSMAASGARLFFSGENARFGLELWTTPLGPS